MAIVRVLTIWALAIACWLAAAASGQAQTRVALIIGNGAYQHTSRLPNPRNDAEDVAAALGRLKFETIVAVDADKRGMDDAIIRFARAARNADVALFYYSGHAIQYAGVNYLLPVDAVLTDEADLRRLTRVDEIVADLRQARALRVLVLDACRDNPLADDLRRSIGRTRAASIQRGLAPIRVERGEGIITAYATQAGRTAADGHGRNSPYTDAFLKHIERPEEIRRVFDHISDEVAEKTNRQQLPEMSVSVTGQFFLKERDAAYANEPPARAGADPGQQARGAPSPAAGLTAEAAQAWTVVQNSDNSAVLDAFIRRYGGTFYGELARLRLKTLLARSTSSSQSGPPSKPAPKPATRPALKDEAALAPEYTAPPRPSSPLQGPVFTSGKSLGAVGSLPPAPPAIDFPTRPITLVVPTAAGGPTDVTIRLVAQRMSDILGQRIVIENRPGTVGTIQAMNAAADGYTLILGNEWTHVFYPQTLITPYDPVADFAAIGLVGATPVVIVSHAGNPARDLQALLAQIAAGGSIHGSNGAGMQSHVACVYFQQVAGTSAGHRPSKGMASALGDILKGSVTFACMDLTVVRPFVRSGKLKAYAIAAAERSPLLPAVPTTAELGLANYRMSLWFGLFAPKQTPAPVVARLNHALAHALEHGPVQKRVLDQFGELPTRGHRSAAALTAFLRTEINRLVPIYKLAQRNFR